MSRLRDASRATPSRANASGSSFANTRIVWPEEEPPDPAEGAEVLLIEGVDRDVRFRLHDACVEASSIRARRWETRPQDALRVRDFSVSTDVFRTRWKAATLILGARMERTTPAPPESSSPPVKSDARRGRWWRHWDCVRASGDTAPRFVDGESERSRDSDGVERWQSLRLEALYWLFNGLALESLEERDGDPAAWFAFFDVELASDLPLLDIDSNYAERTGSVYTQALRIVGEYGPSSSSAMFDAFDAKLAAMKQDAPVVVSLRAHAAAARTKLRLRFDFDSTLASKSIREIATMETWSRDFRSWTRRRFREADPKGYLRLLAEDLLRDDAPGLLHESMLEASSLPREFASPGFDSLLADADPAMRFAAANAALCVDSTDAPAVETLEALVRDESIQPPKSWDLATWPRGRAVDLLVRADRWTPADVRRRLDGPESADGAWAKALIGALGARDAKPPRKESVRVFVHALEAPLGWGVYVACNELLALGDVSSLPTIEAAIARIEKTPVADAPADALDVLRRKLAVGRAAAK